MGLMNRRALLIITGCLAAAGARAEPRAEDGVVDPWAPVKPLPVATWSPAPIALIVNPWGEQAQRRVAPAAPAHPAIPSIRSSILGANPRRTTPRAVAYSDQPSSVS
jgi:hypothetical protein